MKRVKLLSTTILLLIIGCGAEPPKKPSVRIVTAGAQGSQNEFNLFVSRVDNINIQENDAAENFPALILQSQLRLLSVNLGSSTVNRGQESGRCLLYNNSSAPFEASDVELGNIIISPGGRLAYTSETGFNSADCQELFRDSMRSRFQKDFFQLYASFFSFEF